MTDFGAILTAMVTPFDAQGRVDQAATVKLLDHLFNTGSDGVVVCGTTGEAATLSDEEHLGFIRFVTEQTRAQHPGKTVIAGVGSNDTRHAVHLTEQATAARPDGLLAVNPYYNKPGPRGVKAHYSEVVKATDLPILLYNIPGRTGEDLSNELLKELAQLDHIVGVKQANANNLAKIDGLSIYAGDDDTLAAVLDLGEPGGILTGSHIFGTEFRRLADDPENRAAVNAGLRDTFTDLSIAPRAVSCKAALNLIGVNVGGPRLPYVALDESETDVIRVLLERHGLLGAKT
ncbi:MAG: 4-hydroxy-tetrahydrodipicolinate synthase [Solirubrobacterales bacterium]|nr:4-hydroxy-tetrahydrodipicolinate synthase [Solirubrobacterales bacterium]